MCWCHGANRPGIGGGATDPGVEVPTDPELVEVDVHCVSVIVCVDFNHGFGAYFVC